MCVCVGGGGKLNDKGEKSIRFSHSLVSCIVSVWVLYRLYAIFMELYIVVMVKLFSMIMVDRKVLIQISQ